MKMKYQKPMAAVEFYKLSQSIASCIIKINYLSNMCVVMDDDTPELMRSAALVNNHYFSTDCAKVCTNNPEFDGLCYHTQVNACFTS
ncbi:MAG: hypothetical protein IKJ83_00275 [Ruminococcus sp.]|nr:hypothetical protein [Ruminococcus sp.]